MRKRILGSAAVAAFVAIGSAQAADLPASTAPVYKAPAMAPPPVLAWTGVYLGAEGGGGWGHENFNVGIPPGLAISLQPDGGIFGGVLGYRYQTGQIVFGVEGTGAWADLKGSVSPTATATGSLRVQSLYTATGQVGWAVDQALPYLKGGWAGSSVNASVTTAVGGFASQTQFDNGWTVGAGLDYAVWQNFVLGVEYDYFNLGYSGFSTVGILGHTYLVTNPSHMTIDQVIGRVTYKFGMP